MQSTQLVLLLLVGASMWSGAVGLIPEVVPEFPRADPCVPAGVCGEPLFLTPLIQAGSIKQAQQEAEVTLEGLSRTTYSGFVTVNTTTNSNLFFWYLPSMDGNPDAPLVMWLQGGPGASSLFGLFAENGPIQYINGTLSEREVNWNQHYGLLYFDSPVGAGFSFTSKPAGYTFTEDQVSNDMYTALVQFFTMFPDLADNDFYVAGESYGGKYVPAVSYKIHQMNQGSSAHHINLVGLSIGDGWCDPASQEGLVDGNQQAVVAQHMNDTLSLIAQGQYVAAYHSWNLVWGDFPLGFPSLFTNWTGSTDTTNFLRTAVPDSYLEWGSLVTSAPFHKAVHVGATPFGVNANLVYKNMRNDFMHTITPLMTDLLENYKVLVYNGQVDAILGSVTGEAFLNGCKWSGSAKYRAAPRGVWHVTNSTDVGGFARCVDNLVQVVVRGAGHFVPADQPQRAYDLITRFIDGTTKGMCPSE